MKQLSLKLFLSYFLLTIFNLAIAAEERFCSAYNPEFTRMQATDYENNTAYSGFPAKISAEELKKLAIKNTYCPRCTLPDQNECNSRPCQSENIMPGTIYQGIQTKGDPWMKMASEAALKSVQHGGGPFGAVILQIDDQTNKIIRYWTNHNHVMEWSDPTAHAEVTTIRAAAKELGVVDLGHINKKDAKLSQPGEWSHCVIYSSAEPCPMCLSAIYWSGIKSLAFAATRFDAAVKGVNFSDEMIYNEIARPYNQRKHMHVIHANTDNSLDAFNYYKRSDVARYGATP